MSTVRRRSLLTLLLGATMLCAGPLVVAPAAASTGAPEWAPFRGSARLLCSWGNPGGGGVCLSYHGYFALDIGMDIGTPITAAGPGTVTVAQTTNTGAAGLYVQVTHPNGQRSRYMHLSRVDVTVGQTVATGDQLGLSGISGNATIPHLHYEETDTAGTTKIDPGPFSGRVGASVVTYPSGAGYATWRDVPYGTVLRNDGVVAVPGAPTGVTAVAGNGQVTISWQPPASDGGAPITGYVIGIAPTNAVLVVPPGTSYTLTGLTNGAPLSFAVAARNVAGPGPASAWTASVTPQAELAAGYHPVTPVRILDTRDGTGLAGAFGPGQSRSLTVAGRGGVPPSGATAVVMNVTAVGASAPTHVTVWPGGEARPTASNLNVVPGQAVPNLVVAKLGIDGTVSLFNNSGSLHLIADVVGWYDAGTAGSARGDRFVGVTPTRILDTRDGTGGWASPFPAQEPRAVAVTGVGDVPEDATAVVLNVTVTGPTRASHLNVWPAGGPEPNTSSLNYVAGQTVPNLVVAKVGVGGAVMVENHEGRAEVIADVVGYFTSTAGDSFSALPPSRLLDTREGLGSPVGALGAGQTLALTVAGRGGVPVGAKAVVLNVTVSGPSAPSHLTVWPSGVPMPLASNLNFVAGQTVPNLVMIRVGPDGRVSLFNNAGSVHVIADVVGWYG